MVQFLKLQPPDTGDPITIHHNADGSARLSVPDHPVIPFIEGDGIGPDLMRAARRVLDAAVANAYGRQRQLGWYQIYAGEASLALYGDILPQDTLTAIREYIVALKGPLTTPIGGGFRSINVTLRQVLDLYACIRPVRYFDGVPSPMREPQRLNVVIFRENTEDVYAGIEWAKDSPEAARLIDILARDFGKTIRHDSGIGIKPISQSGSARLVRKALAFAVAHGRKSVTLVHKGNIMKYTEGAFRDWGYQVARQEFGHVTVTEEELDSVHGGKLPQGKILVNDRIADSMFQQLLLRPDEYDVIATTNLNGDYLSDACAAQVGGLGMAPGANVSDTYGVFEATHGSAPKYANLDVANPGSLILSGCMMLEYLGWTEAADMIHRALSATISQKKVTYDLHRLMDGAVNLKTSEFAQAIIQNL